MATKQTANAKKSTKTAKPTRSTKAKLTPWGWIWRMLVSLAIPLGVGGLSALISGDAMSAFGNFQQPPLSPPAWVFPAAWTILYILMGIACFVVWGHPVDKQITAREKTTFFVIYGVQLIFNFLWSIFFFNLGWHWFAFGWLVVLWAMILTLVIWGGKNHRAVMWLLLPYLLWVAFAGYLNLMIAILN